MSTRASNDWWSSPITWVGVLVLIALAIVIALSLDERSTDPAVTEIGAAVIEGSALPPFESPDTGIGLPVPGITASSFDGTEVQLSTDGSAAVYGFFAHWCPHCQAELPRMAQWLKDNDLPEGVDVIAISTAVDQTRSNYPPSEWFAREDWPATVVIDSADNAVASAFGLTAFPFWVAADSDGNVVRRITGEINDAQLVDLINSVTPTATG